MASQTTSPLAAGQVFEIMYDTFTPRITIRSEHELDVEMLRGENAGFTDTVDYEAISIRDGLVLLSWQEHIGSTIVHALDFTSGTAYTAITPANGDFMRVTDRIIVKTGS